ADHLHALLVKPLRHANERIVERLERLRLDGITRTVAALTDRHHDRVAVNIDPCGNPEHLLHALTPPDAGVAHAWWTILLFVLRRARRPSLQQVWVHRADPRLSREALNHQGLERGQATGIPL